MLASPVLAASHCCHAVGDKKLASSQGPKKLVFPPSWPRIRLSWHMPKSTKFKIIYLLWRHPKNLKMSQSHPCSEITKRWRAWPPEWAKSMNRFKMGLHTTTTPLASHREYEVCRLAALKWSPQSTSEPPLLKTDTRQLNCCVSESEFGLLGNCFDPTLLQHWKKAKICKKTDRIYNHHPHLESRCWPRADALNWQWKRRSSICGLALRVKG